MGKQGTSVNVYSICLKVNVWVPPDISKLVDAMKSFIPNAAMVHMHSVDVLLVPIDDEVVKISAVLLRPHHSLAEVALDPGKISVVYICELPEIKGKFNKGKAAALGLKEGPKFGQLQSGISVESDHFDIIVHPSDVMEPSVPGPIVLLVDCPTIFHLPELLSLQSLTPYYLNTSKSVETCKIVNCDTPYSCISNKYNCI